jgi:hypothetical protein
MYSGMKNARNSTIDCCLLHANLLFHLLFNPEDGRGIPLIQVGWVSADEKGIIPRRQ